MMEPGTIVECIWDFNIQAENVILYIYNTKGIYLTVPEKGGLYTIRKIFRIVDTGFIGLLLEEIKNPINLLPAPQNGEIGFDIRGFREVLANHEVDAQSIVKDILNESSVKQMAYGVD